MVLIGRLHRTSWLEFIGFSMILASLLVVRGAMGGLGMVLVMQAGGLIVVFDRAMRRRIDGHREFGMEKERSVLSHLDRHSIQTRPRVLMLPADIEAE